MKRFMHSHGSRPCGLLLWSLAAFAVGSSAHAREYSPRVVSPHNADAYSMKTFAEYDRWRNLKGDALAWEVYRYLADPRTGLFPLGSEVLEGDDALSEFQTVRDPVKLINVYGYGYCGILGPTMAGVCQEMGIGKSRTLTIPDWNHVAAETFYDGRWHYLDLDVRAAFRRPDGSLASMAEAQHDVSLWKGPQRPLFFPLDPLGRTRQIYEKTAVHHYNGHYSSGHTMDFVLRQGETFKRWWYPQDGRWQHIDSYNRSAFHRQLLEQEPRGPKCKHPGWTIHTHGNGRFIYQPDLTDRSSDFEDGVFEADNVTATANGLTLQHPGQGHAIFEVRLPYIIVPRVGKIETREDDREASVVQLDGTGVTPAISLDNGLTWKELDLGRGRIDLTRQVSGTYGYLLKLVMKGAPAEAVVRALAITTWVQVAPASLPSLRRGINRMEYRTGDHYGLATRVVEIRTNGSDHSDFLKNLHEAPEDLDAQRKTARARGPFVARVQAPPNSRIAWLSAGASFSVHQNAAAPNTQNSIAFAASEPRDFRVIYQSDIPTDQGHWHYNVDREVQLERPAQIVYLRYVGDPGVNNLRVYAHCTEDRPPTGSPVRIKHAWIENGALRSQTVTLVKPGPYQVTTTADPVDESIEMSIPSLKVQ